MNLKNNKNKKSLNPNFFMENNNQRLNLTKLFIFILWGIFALTVFPFGIKIFSQYINLHFPQIYEILNYINIPILGFVSFSIAAILFTLYLKKIKRKILPITPLILISLSILFNLVFSVLEKKYDILFFYKLNTSANISILIITAILITLINNPIKNYLEENNKIIKFLFLITLILLSAFFFLVGYQENLPSILKTILKNDLYKNLLIILTIFFGTLTYYFEQKRISTDLKKEEADEKLAEDKRKKEFSKKYPKVNKIPIIKSLTNWLYQEGWKSILILALIVAIFLFVRISIPLEYSGNYPDEYNHIINGLNFFNEGELAVTSNRGAYDRGANMSILVGLLLTVLGEKLIFAKLAPILISLISLIFVYLIAKKVFSKKIYIYLALIFITFNPICLLNHTYIRFFVFVEFFLLIILFCFIKIIESIKKNKNGKLLFFTILTLLLSFLCYFSTNDPSGNLILIATLAGFVYLYLFEIQNITFKKNNFPTKILNPLFSLNIKEKIIILLIILLMVIPLLYLFSNLGVKINYLLYYQTNTPSGHINFMQLFFNINIVFTALIIFLYPFSKNLSSYQKISILIFTILFIIHGISGKDLQIIRGMMYLLPLFFIISLISLSNIEKTYFKSSKKIPILIIIIFIIITIPSIKKSYDDIIFDNGLPHINHEIAYYEYGDAYNYIKNNLSDYLIIQTVYSNQLDTFYNVTTDYKIDFNKKFNKHYRHYYDQSENRIKLYYTDTPVITDKNELYDIVNETKTCIILMPYSDPHFLDEESMKYIYDNFYLDKKFIGFTFYCKEKPLSM